MTATTGIADYRLALASYILLYERYRPDCAGGALMEIEAAIAAYLVDACGAGSRIR